LPAFSTFPDRFGVNSDFINVPRCSYLLDSLDIFLEFHRTFS
jgi:hypothetical protein